MRDSLLERAKHLKLHGLVAHWEEIAQTSWVEQLISWEETERTHRGTAARLKNAHLGRFTPLAQFDWQWPKKCDRQLIEELMQLTFIQEAINVVICGPNGVGKSTIAQNIAYQATLQGYRALFTTASQMLNELTSQDGENAMRRRLLHYIKPKLLVIDEMGYLSYSNRHADLMFEIISRRYQSNPTIITTNKPFAEWGEIFPNASCVVSLIDRLVHRSEIIDIEGESYRLKQAQELAKLRRIERSKKKKSK